MENTFIKWLDSYPEFREGDIRRIMDDAIRCYKFDIPRPALMLSYIGFMFAVRQNVNNADAPKGYKDTEWAKRKYELFNDRQWEENLQSLIQSQNRTKGIPGGGKEITKAAVFDIPDSLREDVKFWKNRRNDCAHYKDNTISLSHVSAFWQFLMSNYHMFYPQGSIETCIVAYKEFYDRSLTPEGSNDSLIFKKLISVTHTVEDLVSFLKGISKLGTPMDRYEMMYRLFHDTNERIHGFVMEIFQKNPDIALRYVLKYKTDASAVLGEDPAFVRKLWYEERDTDIFCLLLSNGLIPQDQLHEALTRRAKMWKSLMLSYVDEENRKVLDSVNFWDVLIETVFVVEDFKNNYQSINNNWQLYADAIKICPMDEKLVRRLVECFSNTNYPYILRTQIKSKMLSGEMDKEHYLEYVRDFGLNDPFNLEPPTIEQTLTSPE